MGARATPSLPLPPLATQWAEDLRALAWLHAGERDRATLVRARREGFPQDLALGPLPSATLSAMGEALDALAQDTAGDLELAADYAGIYLTHACRAAPFESVWRDEDGLVLQQPTFDVRAFFRRHGVAAADWRVMADDHLALELEFVALLLERGDGADALHFLDEHLMIWMPAFAEAVERRAATAFYRSLARLSVDYCACLRRHLDPATAGVHATASLGDGP